MPTNWADDTDVTAPEIELSATPGRPDRRFRLSPTDLASLFAGHGSLRLDDQTNEVFFEDGTEDEVGDSNRDSNTKELPATVFGEMVHRLCELRPPVDRWDDVLEQVFIAEDVKGVFTRESRDRAMEHAERAIDYVDQLHAECDIKYTYDELYVTAEFDRGQVAGLIDHLVVTSNAYHIVDYKTNDISVDEISEKADYYRTQMEAYAVALNQQDPDRTVTATLYFTTPSEATRFVWDSRELDDVVEDVKTNIHSAMDAIKQ